jgi:hypothetical protein
MVPGTTDIRICKVNSKPDKKVPGTNKGGFDV